LTTARRRGRLVHQNASFQKTLCMLVERWYTFKGDLA